LVNLNKQPYITPPRWWQPRLSPRAVRLTRPYRRWQLRKQQKIQSVHVYGGEHLQSALDANQGVMVTPNHAAHYDSAALYLAADQLNTPLYYMTAWQVFGMASRWDQFLMQRLGCFSVDRESSDRKAYRQAVEVLQQETCPLVVFPEGDIYHTTDRVTPFREGAAAVAVAAARRSDRPVVIVPCGIKFWYVDDPTPRLHRLMTRLDERMYLRPQPDRPLAERIYRFAEAILSLKEIEFLGTSQAGPITDRIRCLAEKILSAMEPSHGIRPNDKPIPDRVKELRRRIIGKRDRLTADHPVHLPPSPELRQALEGLSSEMDDLFFVMQLYSYPGDYLTDNPSVERLAETLDKFEEDILGHDIPSVHGRRRVDISFGEPIEVSTQSTGREAIPELTANMRDNVQQLINQLAAKSLEAKPHAAARSTDRDRYDRSVNQMTA